MPKLVDHDAYRIELMEGSAGLFAEHGFAAVSIRKVAKELGVSTGTLYHYFPSKEALFEATVEYVIGRNATMATAALRPQVDQGLRLGVRDLLGFLLMQEEQQMAEFVVLMDYWRMHTEGRDALRPALKKAHYAYAGIVAELLGTDDIGLGELVLAVLVNVIQQRWLHGPSFDHERQIELLEQLVEQQLA